MGNRLVSFFLVTLFLGTMFFSLFHMSMSMDSSDGMSDCPFMSHEEMLCPMNVFDHLMAWKSVFSVIVPTLMFVLAAAQTILFLASVAPNLLLKVRYAIPIVQRAIRERTYSYTYRPLQELFSNGILHPKLF